MLRELPWEIQRNILQFDVKRELHQELKKKIKMQHELEQLNIQDKCFRLFVKNCILTSTLTDERQTAWYVWILKKVFSGEKPWNFIYSEYSDLILYLKKCQKLRFRNHKIYGFSIKSWIIRLIS